jgi:hypothetical protein
MIFGFNSDVHYGDVVYHVQSEVRQRERRLETQIFVRGRCISTRSALLADGDSVTGTEVQEMLREQHRKVVQAIRAGDVKQFSIDSV